MTEVFEGHFNTGVKVGDIMHHGVITIKENDSLFAATQKMLVANIDSLVIMQDKKAKGIITKSDIIRALSKDKPMKNTKVKTVMSSPVKTISANLDVTSAIEQMRDFGVTKIPVVQKGKIAGIITQEDMVKAIPGLFELIYEAGNESRPMGRGDKLLLQEATGSGYCSECNVWSDALKYDEESRLICPQCIEEPEHYTHR